MYRVRGKRGLRGLWDDTRNLSSLSAAWCRSTGLCTDAWMKASNTLVNPDLHIPVLPTLAKAAGAPSNLKYPVETPGDLAAAQFKLDTAARLKSVSDFFVGDVPGGTNWWLWLGLGLAGVFAVMTVVQPGARRYGR